MNTKKNRIKNEAATVYVPQTREQTTESIARIGECQRERQRIEAAMNDELARIKEQYELKAKPFGDEITQLSKGVQLWCEANRAQLTNEDKFKTVNLASGEIKWRMRPPSVGVRNAEGVIESLERLRLDRFVRVKKEINKEAILAEPQAVQDIKGITVSQREDFVIVPFETQLEEVQ